MDSGLDNGWAETTDGESIRIAINGPANPARGAPTITGTAQLGETLTAVTSGISDADGLTSPVYTYQWIRVDGGTDAHITGATSITYVPVAADTGKTIRVRVRFTDDLNYSEQRTSAATAAVNAPATGEPTISGITQVGETLTAVPSLIMDANGLTSPGYTYQWIRVDGTDINIPRAANTTYTLGDADNGKPIKVRVRFTDDDGYSEERTSAATVAVSPPPPAGLLVSITVDEGDEQITDGRPTPSSVPNAKFRVSIPAALTANLDVTINISEVSDTRTDLGNAQTANYVAAAGEGPKTVTIPAGDTSAVHETPIETFSSNSRYEGDQVFEQDGDVLAEVAPGFGYRASASAPSASVRVLDVDQRFQIRALHSDGSPLTGGARLAHIRVDEGAGRLVLLAECVTLYDREPRSRITLKFSLTTQAADPISAEYRNNQDYRSFAEQVACREEGDPLLGWTSTSGGDLGVPPSSTGFRRVQRDGGYIYQSVYTGVHQITDDQVYDPDEFFGVKLQRGPNLTNKVALIGTATPGLTGSGFSHRVTILDDARPPANLEATVEGVRVGLTWDELTGDRAVETYEVKVNDGPWRALDTGPRTHTWVGGLTPGVENTITVGARYWGPERPRFGRGDCDVFNCSVTVMGPMLDTAHADGPGAVTGLAVVSRMALGEAELSWTPPSDTGASGISGYQWRATGGSFDVEPEFLNQWHDIATSVMETDGNTTSAIINWMEGVDHTIYVRAWSGLKKYRGAVASVTLTGTGANQPTNLRATTVADTWVTLSWTAPSVRPGTIDEYHVETRDPFTDNQWSYGGEGTGGNGTTYTVEGLEPGVRYIFRVRGRSDSLGLFTPSDYFARGTLSAGSPARALAHVVYPPGATSLFASANGGSRIDLGWITTNPASTSYDLEWSADGATWQAVDPDDDGADTTYGHTGLTAGTTYYYRVRGVNGDGPGPWALAAATTTTLAPREAQAANTPATGAPSISGTAQVGETLTSDTSDIADADGLAKAAFSYQWQAGGADISGATDSTYTLVDDDAGKAVSVAVSFTDDAGSAESVTSAATAAVAAPPLTASFENAPSSHDGSSNFTFDLRFSEELRVGYRTLRDHAFTVDGGTVRNASRLEPGSNRGWRIEVRPNVNDDVTVVLPVTTDCNDDGAICTEDGRKLSSRVELTVNGPEQQAVNSPATGAPTISGTAQVGGTLTADTSGVADDDGLTNAAFSYQWQADGADISGATASTYTLADADKGAAISVTVSFTDDAGNEESLTSAATAAVEAAADPHAPQEAQGAAGGDAAEPTDRPHGLTAEASGGAVVLTWKAPEGYRSDYRILRNRPELGEAEPLVYVAYTDTTDVTYTDTDVEPGVLYVYSVTALDFLGDAGEASRPVEIRMQATSQQQTANSPATGAPTITGTAQVGETLTADVSGILDEDGLTNAVFSYQWVVNEESDDSTGASYTVVVADDGSATWVPNDGTADTDIEGATGPTYTLTEADEGRPIRVRVSFTDDSGNSETLISAPTLMAGIHAAPTSHDGESAFTFELRFSEEFGISYKTLRDHAFTVTGGAVRKAQRLEQGSNVGWRITVSPDSSGAVTIILPITEDCDAQGAICTEDGRKLSTELELTVSGP